VRWSRLEFDPAAARHVIRGNLAAPGKTYLAATLVGPGRIAAVTAEAVYWLKAGSRGLPPWFITEVPLAGTMACFHSLVTGELLIVCADVEKNVEVVRVPVPA
jgi:hypothetical protein